MENTKDMGFLTDKMQNCYLAFHLLYLKLYQVFTEIPTEPTTKSMNMDCLLHSWLLSIIILTKLWFHHECPSSLKQ